MNFLKSDVNCCVSHPKLLHARAYSSTVPGFCVFGNRSSLELLATEIDGGPRRSRAKLCALIDVETPL